MKLYRTIHLKVFTSDGKGFERFTLSPPPGKLWHQTELPRHMSEFIWALKDQFPGNEFKAIKVTHNRYNIVPQPLNHLDQPIGNA